MARKSGSSVAVLGENVTGFSSGYGVIDVVSGIEHVLFPRATLIELYGLKSSSKTTLVLETIAFNQMLYPDFKVYYADFEKMLRNQSGYLQSLGVNLDPDVFEVGEFDTMEEGCDKILKVVRENLADLIVVDTVAAMRPLVELEKGFAQNKQPGIKGKLMSEFLRNMMADMPSDGPAVVFINQMYKDIMNSTFAQLYTTPSSDSLAFYAGIRYEIRETTKLKAKEQNPYTFEEEEIPVASIIQIKGVKNKVGKPFQQSKYAITYGKGIDISHSIISAAIKRGLIHNKGNSKSSYLYPTRSGEEKSAVGMTQLNAKLLGDLDTLVYLAENLSDLWAYDAQFIIQRLERKAAFSSNYNGTFTEGESLNLGLEEGESVEEEGYEESYEESYEEDYVEGEEISGVGEEGSIKLNLRED